MRGSFKKISFDLIKKKLLVLFFITFPLVLLSSYYVVQYSLDSNLKQNASIILSVAQHELSQMDNYHHAKSFSDDKDVLFQVFMDNNITLHSKNAPDGKIEAGLGVSTIIIDDECWRIFHYEEDEMSLYVGEKIKKRYYILYWTMFIVSFLYIIFTFVILSITKKITQELTRQISSNIEDVYNEKELHVLEEFKPVIDKINEYKSKLEQANEKEREFLEHVSHELRTPLSILKINIEKYGCGQELTKSYDKIENIITQFLLFSKGDRGHCKNISIVEAITGAIEDILIIHPEIEFDFDIQFDFEIYANMDLLKLVFSNFIMNAINKGAKNISFDIRNKQVLIEDYCYPIVEEDKIRGYGIGLVLVEKILNRLQANYILENNTKGGVTAKINFK